MKESSHQTGSLNRREVFALLTSAVGLSGCGAPDAVSPDKVSQAKKAKAPDSSEERIPTLISTQSMWREAYAKAKNAYPKNQLYSLPPFQKAEMDNAVKDMYRWMQYKDRIPGVKRLPPEPVVLQYIEEEFDMQAFRSQVENIGASVVVMSSGTLKELTSKRGIQYGLAHEIGHLIIRLNPDLLQTLLPMDNAVAEEIVRRNITDPAILRRFAEELVADRIAMLITRDLNGAKVFFSTIDQQRKRLIPQVAKRAVEEREKERGSNFFESEKSRLIEENTRKLEAIVENGVDEHPTIALRFKLMEKQRQEQVRNEQGGKWQLP
jgi:hypothetical protein